MRQYDFINETVACFEVQPRNVVGGSEESLDKSVTILARTGSERTQTNDHTEWCESQGTVDITGYKVVRTWKAAIFNTSTGNYVSAWEDTCKGRRNEQLQAKSQGKNIFMCAALSSTYGRIRGKREKPVSLGEKLSQRHSVHHKSHMH
jgi:hypothetical protein